MNDRNFLLAILKLSPPLIKAALVSLSADRVEGRTAPISSDLITEVDSTLSAVLELVRQHQYFQARDMLVKIRSNLVLLRPKRPKIFYQKSKNIEISIKMILL